MMYVYAIGVAVLFGIMVIAIFLGPMLYLAWDKGECSRGGEHEDELLESSPTPPFPEKHRCTKCGRVTATATYAL
ncbi:hypothetical protein HY634_03900 [Candidatus Uhrbacteria bacterium]|nr:hypothetical protein [Candidatus Uhrbacteria bacterium]